MPPLWDCHFSLQPQVWAQVGKLVQRTRQTSPSLSAEWHRKTFASKQTSAVLPHQPCLQCCAHATWWWNTSQGCWGEAPSMIVGYWPSIWKTALTSRANFPCLLLLTVETAQPVKDLAACQFRCGYQATILQLNKDLVKMYKGLLDSISDTNVCRELQWVQRYNSWWATATANTLRTQSLMAVMSPECPGCALISLLWNNLNQQEHFKEWWMLPFNLMQHLQSDGFLKC